MKNSSSREYIVKLQWKDFVLHGLHFPPQILYHIISSGHISKFIAILM